MGANTADSGLVPAVWRDFPAPPTAHCLKSLERFQKASRFRKYCSPPMFYLYCCRNIITLKLIYTQQQYKYDSFNMFYSHKRQIEVSLQAPSRCIMTGEIIFSFRLILCLTVSSKIWSWNKKILFWRSIDVWSPIFQTYRRQWCESRFWWLPVEHVSFSSGLIIYTFSSCIILEKTDIFFSAIYIEILRNTGSFTSGLDALFEMN